MTASAGRRRRASGAGAGRISTYGQTGGRTGDLVRWQGVRRRSGAGRLGVWIAVGVAVLSLTLALIARAVGGLHWGNLLMLIPAGVLAMVFGAGLIALIRRAAAWLAG